MFQSGRVYCGGKYYHQYDVLLFLVVINIKIDIYIYIYVYIYLFIYVFHNSLTVVSCRIFLLIAHILTCSGSIAD